MPRELARRRPLALTAVLLCSVGAALAAVALPAVLGRAVDRVTADAAVPWPVFGLAAALTAAEVLLDAAVALLGGTTTAGLTAWLRGATVDRLLRAEPRHGQAFAPGDLTARLTANAADAATAPVTVAGSVAGLLLPAGGLIGLLLVDHWTAAALLVGVPALVVLLRTFARHTADTTADYQRAQADLATRLTEALEGAATIRAAHTGAREYTRILEPLTALDVHGRRTWQVFGRATGHSAVLLPLLTFLVLAVAGLRLAAGAISVGDLVAVSRYTVLAVGVGSLTGALGALSRSHAAARRIDPLLALPAMPHRSDGLPPGGPGTLELRDVEVTRDGKHLLRKVSLTLPGGSSTAVVGLSGSGKSVLAAVAGRLTDPDAGTVTLDGTSLAAVEVTALRRDVTYAFARPALLGTTIRDTIAFGAGRPSAEQIRSAARSASAHGFISLLPLGYDTPLSEAPLSGGERQRLGLARAFAHPGRLLVLDDATSSLDTVTEREVQRALADRAGSRTRLIVAHRLSSAVDADQVVWIENGAVRAVGPHSELWADPFYRAVFAAVPPEQRPRGGPADAGDGAGPAHLGEPEQSPQEDSR
ncbi:ABC transporter ATP-binding protein/permease [Streptomyces sp. NBC_01013]|nr:ABC transporter ATP-binding protein/permease [Streptomyces sp. NBC_01013]